MATDPRWTKEELAAGAAWRRARRQEWRQSPEGRREARRKLAADLVPLLVAIAVLAVLFALNLGE